MIRPSCFCPQFFCLLFNPSVFVSFVVSLVRRSFFCPQFFCLLFRPFVHASLASFVIARGAGMMTGLDSFSGLQIQTPHYFPGPVTRHALPTPTARRRVC